MKIFPAKIFDIPEILKIERSAFIPGIQESAKTFEERLAAFPQGFLILQDSSQTAAGYFTSEIWSAVPASDDFYGLNHSTKKLHTENGSVLYVSSFALLPNFRGKGLAEPFFEKSLRSICSAFLNIKTVLLIVNKEWQGARHIYEKLGFSADRVIPGFFESLKKEKSDAVVMSCAAAKFQAQE